MIILSTNQNIEKKINGQILNATLYWGSDNGTKVLEIVSKSGQTLKLVPEFWTVVPLFNDKNYSDPYRWNEWFKQMEGKSLVSAINSTPVPIAGVAVKTKNSCYLLRPQNEIERKSLATCLREFPHLSETNTQFDDVQSVTNMAI